jgi:hypothetical protein
MRLRRLLCPLEANQAEISQIHCFWHASHIHLFLNAVRGSSCHAFFSSVLTDLGLWIRFLRKESMSQVTLPLVVLGVAVWGYLAPYRADD